MSRLYHNNQRFDELSPTVLSESEFEQVLMSNSGVIWPNSVAVPFKKTVHSASGSARPDLAVISADYRYWVIVEVEMIRHSLYGHVIPQVTALRDGVYDESHAKYIKSKCPELDERKLSDLMRGDSPDVLVVMNKPDTEWLKEMRRYNIQIMFFEIFRSENGSEIYAISGQPSAAKKESLCELIFRPSTRLFRVSAPAVLPEGTNDTIPILVEGQVTYWRRIRTRDEVYLHPVGALPIDPAEAYRHELYRSQKGDFLIQTSTKKEK